MWSAFKIIILLVVMRTLNITIPNKFYINPTFLAVVLVNLKNLV